MMLGQLQLLRTLSENKIENASKDNIVDIY